MSVKVTFMQEREWVRTSMFREEHGEAAGVQIRRSLWTVLG